MKHTSTLPENWQYKGTTFKGSLGTKVFIFTRKTDNFSKGFSSWEVQPPTKSRAFEVLKEWIINENH